MDASEKQGYLGDLKMKTSDEIKEILQRQTKLFTNITFVSKLPDKGERMKIFVQRLEEELKARQDVESTADLFHKMALDAEIANRSRGKCINTDDNMEDQETNNPLNNIVNRATDEKQIIDHRIDLSKINTYERVIQKADKRPTSKKKFFPHKTVKIENISQMAEGNKLLLKDIVSLDSPNTSDTLTEDTTKSNTNNKNCDTSMESETTHKEKHLTSKHCAGTNIGQKSENPKLKHRYDDSLEMSVYSPSQKYGSTKMITIEDSIEIFEKQKKSQELIQAQQASKRLAEKLGVKMVDFEPKNFEMRYRNKTEESDEHSEDGDADEIDYPD